MAVYVASGPSGTYPKSLGPTWREQKQNEPRGRCIQSKGTPKLAKARPSHPNLKLIQPNKNHKTKIHKTESLKHKSQKNIGATKKPLEVGGRGVSLFFQAAMA